MIRDGWIPTGDWKWSKEVSDRNVVLRVSTESAQSENKEWEVFAEDSDGSVFDTPFETTSLSDAVIEAKRMVQEFECEADYYICGYPINLPQNS